jgi:hypothetical protein
MSLRGRLRKLERAAPAPDPRLADPEYRHWRLYYEAALEVLEPFPEARQEVVRRVEVNEPHIFRPDWQRTVTGADRRFYWCKQTLWAALGQSRMGHGTGSGVRGVGCVRPRPGPRTRTSTTRSLSRVGRICRARS